MAMSKCGHCGNHSFEVKEVSPSGSRYKMYFVQCASCGVPVGSMEYISNNVLLQKLTDAVKNIANAMNIHVDL